MPITVHPHPDFESLIQAFGNARPTGPPGLVPIVVPSLTFSDQLQRRIADRQGVCMGFAFLTPQDFIHQAVGPGRGSPWLKDRLLWWILPLIQEGLADLPQAHSQRERLALAGLLADRLDQYGHFRPELIRQWAKGQAAGLAHEDWQRDLWRKARARLGIPHPAEDLEDLGNDPAFRRRLQAAFPELTVLANGTLDPLLTEVLRLLGESGGRVTIHIVLPSLEFLGDLRRRNKLPKTNASPDAVTLEGANPLLVSLGRNAVGAFTLLGELDEDYSGWPEPATPPEEAPTLLARVQSDIRALRAPQDSAPAPDDGSLRVHSCFGRRRELEILRDEILRAFRELPHLRPDEIHIVAPGLEEYASLIPAVLADGDPPLPIHLTEDPDLRADPLVEGLLGILDVVQRGRFEASDVLGLLQKPGVLLALDCEDAELPRRWIRDSGMTRGLGAGSLGGWRAARERLVAGKWFGPESRTKYPDSAFVLPVTDPLRGEPALRDRLLDWLAALEAICLEWESAATPSEWAIRFRGIYPHLVSSENPEALQFHLAFLEEVAAGNAVELDAGCMADWLAEAVREGPRRARLSGGIAFGRLRHLQNLPCRVLAIVGMDDHFPAADRAPAWDLLRGHPRIWDRNPRTDDRQLFLDALLTPKDRLIITAANRDLRSRKTAPFSSCVDELLRVIHVMGAERPVREHRLQPFAKEYFTRSPLPRSFDATGLEIAKAIHETGKAMPFSDGTMPDIQGISSPPEIPMTTLFRFWKNPAAAFLKAQGVSLPSEIPSDEDCNRPPLVLDGLTEWIIKEEIRRTWKSADPEALEVAKARLEVRRQLPPEKQGDLNWKALRTIMEKFSTAFEAIAGEEEKWTLPLKNAVLTGTVRLTQDASLLLGACVSKMKDTARLKNTLEAWLCSLAAAAAGKPRPTRFLHLTESGVVTCDFPEHTKEEAIPILEDLVEGYLLGQAAPLPFALQTSEVIARQLTKNVNDLALEKGREAWEKEGEYGAPPGDGQSPEALLAWRDRDPFANPTGEQWLHWAKKIIGPLQSWTHESGI